MRKTLVTGVLIFFIFASFLLKWVHFSDPYFGAYLSRQLQTMSTIDAYAAQGIDLLKPRTNYAGWPGHLLFEFPIFQAFAGWLSSMTGHPLVTTRALNLFFALLSVVCVYRMAGFLFNRKTAFYTAVFFSFSPLNIMFHRSSMIDISCVFFALAAHLILLYWTHQKKWWHLPVFFLSGLLCVLIKPLYLLPVVLFFAMAFLRDARPLSVRTFFAGLRAYFAIIVSFALMGSVLALWLTITEKSSVSGPGVFRHLGWDGLMNPQYYLTLLMRFYQQFVNPFNVGFFVLGTVWLWRRRGRDLSLQFLILPVLYYILFPQINLPHSYYSLILIPYFSIVAGCGAAWIEDIVFSETEKAKSFALRVIVCALSSFASVMMFLTNLTAPMILPYQRYAKMAQEVAVRLDPFAYAVVYVNQDGNFSEWERLRNRPMVYLKSFFQNLDEQELKDGHLDSPLVRSAVLYSLKQYGEMNYAGPDIPINLQQKREEFGGELRYVLFYLFDRRQEVYARMKPFEPIYESGEWVVYDLTKTK